MNILKFIGAAVMVFIIIALAVFILYTVMFALFSFITWRNLFDDALFYGLVRCAMVASLFLTTFFIYKDSEGLMEIYD